MKTIQIILILILILTACFSSIRAVDLPVGIEDCLVAFEEIFMVHEGRSIYRFWGTGFLYQDTSTGHVYIATNKHLLVARDSLYIKINEIGKVKCGRILITLKPDTSWFSHPNPNIDLAIIPLHNNEFIQNKDSLSLGNTKIIDSERVKLFKELKIGDEAYFLGFPGIGFDLSTCNYPVLRRGVISLLTTNNIVDACYDTSLSFIVAASQNEIVIDAKSIGGNSGSPVLVPPDPRKNEKRAKLIGVIRRHLSKFELVDGVCKETENLDLAVAIPAEHLLELTKFVDEKRKELNK